MSSLTPEQVAVTDLLYAHGPHLALALNSALAARGCSPRRSVSNVIERMHDEETGAEMRERMRSALEEVLRPFMGPDASLDELLHQWMQGVVGMDVRAACAYPLHRGLEGDGLEELRGVASTQAGFSCAPNLASTLINVGQLLQRPRPAPAPAPA